MRLACKSVTARRMTRWFSGAESSWWRFFATRPATGAVLSGGRMSVLLPRVTMAAGTNGARGSPVLAGIGQRFLPRGDNNVRLTAATYLPVCTYFHWTFEPGRHDRARAETALVDMHASGVQRRAGVLVDLGDARTVTVDASDGRRRFRCLQVA